MKVIIAGGRNFTPTQADVDKLNSLKADITEVVCGGAKGADAFGAWWAQQNGIPVKYFHADWNLHGRAAGPIRNEEMAKYAEAAILFPGGAGTANMFSLVVKYRLTFIDWRS
jgi:hypothetical protein